MSDYSAIFKVITVESIVVVELIDQVAILSVVEAGLA